ncbi:MAG TPA: LCP family protein [Actinomycetota bacterium]|nr:LCP family protein [Actinomycetota bacterium]
MSVLPARRRAGLVVALVAAWVAGSALGATQPARHAAAAPLFQLEPAHAEFVPLLDGTKPIYVLVIGSDARPDQAVESQRADSIHILSINPAEHRASIVGIPRDALVDIPDHGQNKINAALFFGGPELVVETVEQLTGLTMDYWAMTGFASFEAMVDDVDGLVVDVPFAMSDEASRAFFEPGVQRLDGDNALAFARNRHDLPSGDLGRSENQGRLMVAALAQLKKEFNQDPARLLAWVASFVRNGTTTLTLDEVLDLAFTGTAINANKVENIVLPGGSGMVGGLSVVTLNQEALDTISKDLADDGFVKKANVPPSPNESLLGG